MSRVARLIIVCVAAALTLAAALVLWYLKVPGGLWFALASLLFAGAFVDAYAR